MNSFQLPIEIRIQRAYRKTQNREDVRGMRSVVMRLHKQGGNVISILHKETFLGDQYKTLWHSEENLRRCMKETDLNFLGA